MLEDPFAITKPEEPFVMNKQAERKAAKTVHIYGKDRHKHRCSTDEKGFATPNDVDLTELRLDTHLGFVPLWDRNVTLRWRFKESSFAAFAKPEAAKEAVRQLMRDGLGEWGNAVPITFSEQRDLYDFEVYMVPKEDCDDSGCVLASAFFPDGGRHQLKIYPTLFKMDRSEQVETLAHEFGHVFGLRHWFANISETGWPSELFGKDKQFTIMNYNSDSVMTETDKDDLKKLYVAAWDRTLTAINGTPVRLFRPYSSNL